MDKANEDMSSVTLDKANVKLSNVPKKARGTVDNPQFGLSQTVDKPQLKTASPPSLTSYTYVRTGLEELEYRGERYAPRQIAAIMRARPGLSLEDVAAARAYLEAPPPEHKRPLGVLYAALTSGDPIPAPRPAPAPL